LASEEGSPLFPTIFLYEQTACNEINLWIEPNFKRITETLGFIEEFFAKFALESIRQQLSQRRGFVWPYPWKREPPFGLRETLWEGMWNLYNRLPEEDRSDFTPPNFDSIRR